MPETILALCTKMKVMYSFPGYKSLDNETIESDGFISHKSRNGWLFHMLSSNNSLSFESGKSNSSTNQIYQDNLMLMKDIHLEIAAEFLNGLYSHKSPFTITLIVLYTVIFIVGLVGNILVIVVIFKHRYMRTTTNMFLVNLSVGDLLVVIVCMPFSLAPYVYKNWVYGVIICKLTPLAQGISVGVSVLTLLVVSLDRCYAIYHPMKARIFFTRKRVKVILVIIWVIALIISSPLIFVTKVTTRGLPGIAIVHTCQETWKSDIDRNIYNWSIFILLYTIPLVVMTSAYATIGQILWNGDNLLTRNQISRSSVDSQAKNLQLGRRRIVRMLMFVVGSFALSWMPYHVVNIYLDVSQNASQRAYAAMYVYPLCQWLALANSSTNPICFCFLSRSFRSALSDNTLGASQSKNLKYGMYTRVSNYSYNGSSRRQSRASPGPCSNIRRFSKFSVDGRYQQNISNEAVKYSRCSTPSPRVYSRQGVREMSRSSVSSSLEPSDNSPSARDCVVDYSQPTLELPTLPGSSSSNRKQVTFDKLSRNVSVTIDHEKCNHNTNLLLRKSKSLDDVCLGDKEGSKMPEYQSQNKLLVESVLLSQKSFMKYKPVPGWHSPNYVSSGNVVGDVVGDARHWESAAIDLRIHISRLHENKVVCEVIDSHVYDGEVTAESVL